MNVIFSIIFVSSLSLSSPKPFPLLLSISVLYFPSMILVFSPSFSPSSRFVSSPYLPLTTPPLSYIFPFIFPITFRTILLAKFSIPFPSYPLPFLHRHPSSPSPFLNYRLFLASSPPPVVSPPFVTPSPRLIFHSGLWRCGC